MTQFTNQSSVAQRVAIVALCFLTFSPRAQAAQPESPAHRGGQLPADDKGQPLNFDFETGDLRDWQATGEAFRGQPTKGDAVHARRADMRSDHEGDYWVGTFEVAGDGPQGTLTSRPFKVTRPYASFLVAGGSQPSTRVEIIAAETRKPVYQISGDDTENLKAVVVDLSAQVGKEIFLRLVDENSGGWGHLNFDDFCLHDAKPAIPNVVVPQPLDVYAHAGLDPQEAARTMTVPEGFRVTLFAGEPDVEQPIAQAIDDRGRLWVAEAYSYPIRVPRDQAHDRLLIFEDTDGDGHFDTRKVFADNLNLVSGFEIGFGGVWVGAAPEFLFIPDADGDDHPDGPPQVLLDGWGYEDTHETLNTFTWGPDGWLYGCHGVFTHSQVGKPGTPKDHRVRINAGIWRYHPTKHIFEVFAEGTSNPWGIDFNEQGQALLTACVIPHLYHVIQGGRYQRQAGAHFNPYTYDDIKTIALHRHWIGNTPHSGNNRSDAAGGGHAHAGAMIYLGGAWPEKYRGQLFMNNIHGARLNVDQLAPQGSGYSGDRAPDFLFANDSWSQIINLQSGPDGQMYMIDWYDRNQCHHGNVEGHDRSNGRVFKVSYGNAPHQAVDIRKLDDRALVAAQLNRNDWHVRHARRVIQERGLKDPAARKSLVDMAFTQVDATRRLRALWALHAGQLLDEDSIARGLANDDALVRGWTVQLACENGLPPATVLSQFKQLAAQDPSPVVRLYLASAAGRLPLAARWEIVAALARHAEDAGDHNLPLMVWYAAEPLAGSDAPRALALALDGNIPLVASFMARRVASQGTPEAIATVIDQIIARDNKGAQAALVAGLSDALRGRRTVDMPTDWRKAMVRIKQTGDPATVAQAMSLAVTFGDPAAIESMRNVLSDAKAPIAQRQNALTALLKVRDARLAPTLQTLVGDPALRSAALRGLANYEDNRTPAAIINVYPRFSLAEKRDALATLTSRADYAQALLDGVAHKQIAASDLSADLVRQLHNLKDAKLSQKISDVWGTVRDTPADRAEDIAHYKQVLAKRGLPRADVSLGRAVFAKTCQQCHTLFGTGGKVGPELTGSNRANLDYVLSNVLDSSALVGKEYQTTIVTTTDGRVLTGIVRSDDNDSVTLVTANETIVVPKGEIDERTLSPKSMMPDDLWKPLSDHEVRSVVSYLASPEQVPVLLTAENAASFFNGRDLVGWQGDPQLWSVDDGEIVGRTQGLARNEFLRSEMAADDFRLSFDVKLVDNRGNSGAQFRSEALPDGEMRGYQADIGAGWWGKLYEENRRGLLSQESGEKHVKSGEWNHYEIAAAGNHIRTWINGQPCVDLKDPSGVPRGIFALQLHSGEATEVRFKNLQLELNPAAEAAAGQ
ncbi:MAG TPA: PVC-type heme-binding CxxCH protein [Pirellulales bacterium]|jgi:putative membrane-bound dehydrogenase-like protein